MPRNQRSNYVKIYPPPAAPSSPTAPIHIPTKSNIANEIASNVVSGFAFGTGSSIARNTMDNLFKKKHEPEPEPESKSESKSKSKSESESKSEPLLHKEYLECLKHNHEDTCKNIFSK